MREWFNRIRQNRSVQKEVNNNSRLVMMRILGPLDNFNKLHPGLLFKFMPVVAVDRCGSMYRAYEISCGGKRKKWL